MGEKSPFENLVNAVRADDITDQRHAAEVAETIIEESPEVRTFKAPSLYFPTGRVYGGQMVAQALMSAGMSVETKPGPLPHSLGHQYLGLMALFQIVAQGDHPALAPLFTNLEHGGRRAPVKMEDLIGGNPVKG